MALSRGIVDQGAVIVILQSHDVQFVSVLGAVPVFEEPHEFEVSMVTRIMRNRSPSADVEHSIEGVDKALVNQNSDWQKRALAGEISYVQSGLVPLVQLFLRDGTRFIVIRIIRIKSIGGADERRTRLPRILALLVIRVVLGIENVCGVATSVLSLLLDLHHGHAGGLVIAAGFSLFFWNVVQILGEGSRQIGVFFVFLHGLVQIRRCVL